MTPDSKRVRRAVGAVALGIGAALAVVGSTLPVFEQALTFTGEQESFTMTLWGFGSTSDVRVGAGAGIAYGVPVIVAAVLLAVSAVLVPAVPRFAGPTSVAAIGSAAVLTGSVWTVGQLVLVAVSNEDTDTAKSFVGSGMITLVLAVVVALAGGVLVQHWPGQVSEPEDAVVHQQAEADADAEVDVDTPSFGIPAPEDTRGGS